MKHAAVLVILITSQVGHTWQIQSELQKRGLKKIVFAKWLAIASGG